MKEETMNRLARMKAISAVVAAVAALITPIVVGVIANNYTKALRARETNLRYVELSIDILRETPSEETNALREWAIDTIDRFSEVQLDSSARAALIGRVLLPDRIDRPIRVGFLIGGRELGIPVEDTVGAIARYAGNAIIFTGFVLHDPVEETYVIDRQWPRKDHGLLIAKLLGVREDRVVYEPRRNDPLGNVVIVVGDDYLSLPIFASD